MLHKELRERSNRITILTYDDILTNLQFHYTDHYARTDSLPGFSLHTIINIQKGESTEARCFFDCGVSSEKDRISIFFDNERLFFEIIDSYSVSHRVTAQIPEDLFTSNEILYLSCSFGNGENLAVLQLRLNNSIVAESIVLGGLQVSPAIDTGHFTIGQDINGWRAYGPPFSIFELMVYSQNHSLDERMKLLGYVYNRINRNEYTKCVQFVAGACMHCGKHDPPFGSRLRAQFNNLAPKYRHYPFKDTVKNTEDSQ